MIVAQSCRVVAASSVGLGEKFPDGCGSGSGCPGSSPAVRSCPVLRWRRPGPASGVFLTSQWMASRSLPFRGQHSPCWCRIFRYGAPKVCALRPERTCAIRLVLFPEALSSSAFSSSHSCPPSGGGVDSLQTRESFPVGLCCWWLWNSGPCPGNEGSRRAFAGQAAGESAEGCWAAALPGLRTEGRAVGCPPMGRRHSFPRDRRS